jgi:hypothetical protein
LKNGSQYNQSQLGVKSLSLYLSERKGNLCIVLPQSMPKSFQQNLLGQQYRDSSASQGGVRMTSPLLTNRLLMVRNPGRCCWILRTNF